MKTPISTKIISGGNVRLFDEHGHGCGSKKPQSGKAVSAQMNGDKLIVTTDKGRTEVYQCINNGIFYKYSR